jgi:hypothetical protein
MKVKAKGEQGIIVGFYGTQRRRGGDEFDVEDHLFSEKWMEKIEERKRPGPKSKFVEKEGE